MQSPPPVRCQGQALTAALMYSNWRFRSGWLAPSRVLRLAWQLYLRWRNRRPTSFWLTLKPRRSKAWAMFRWLRLVQRNGDPGSPRIASSTTASSAASKPGCVSTADFRPPPGRRTRPSLSRRPAFSSAIPRLIVLPAIPVAAETAVTPPNPMISASFATNNRRPRSSRCGTICSQRARMPSTSVPR